VCVSVCLCVRTLKQVSADVYGSARCCLTSRCTQSWTPCVCDQQSAIVGRRLIARATPAVVGRCCQQQADGCRLFISRLVTVGVPRSNAILSLEFGTKSSNLMKWSSRLSVVCLSLPRQMSKFRHLCGKSGSPSKNMTSDFAPEIAKYPKSILPQQQFRECASLLFRSVSDAACF